jgi:hypothetical protein
MKEYATFYCTDTHEIDRVINAQSKFGWIFDQVINVIGQSGCNNAYCVLMHKQY